MHSNKEKIEQEKAALLSASKLKCKCSKEKKLSSADIIISCTGCSNNIWSGKVSRYSKVVTLIITLTFGAGYYTEYSLSEESRYPLEMEYEILNACINSDPTSFINTDYTKKQELCICMLNYATNETPFEAPIIDGKENLEFSSAFAKSFREGKYECLSKKNIKITINR